MPRSRWAILGAVVLLVTLVAQSSANSLDVDGFRQHAGVRCQGHYRELATTTVGNAECAHECSIDSECAAYSSEQQQGSDSRECFLFGSNPSCVSSADWTSGFKDTRCATAGENEFVLLTCPSGTVITRVLFASFGTPTGICNDFQIGACHDNMTSNVIEDICIGENQCKLSASSDVFADTCAMAAKNLRVQVACSAGPAYYEDSYFNEWSNKAWEASHSQVATRQAAWKAALAAVTAYPADTFSGRGIVMVAGGRYLESAATTIRMLRKLGCTLPIEIWHLGNAEITSQERKYLATYNVQPRNFEDYVDSSLLKPIAANVGFRLFQLKPLAILHSSFEAVLLLDSDNCPLRDPAYLFESREFSEYGAVFWPDYWKTTSANPIWSLVGHYATDTWEQESGQLLINKSFSWTALNLCLHFNSDFYMQLLNGDKDTFRFAWIASNTPFFMMPTLPTAVGTMKERHSDASGFCGHTMLQFDMDAKPLFVHHNQLKAVALPRGENFHFAKSLAAVNGQSIHAVATAGLKVGTLEIPCIDFRGPEMPYVDEEVTVAVDASLFEFESQFLIASKSVAEDFKELAANVSYDSIDAAFRPLLDHPRVTLDLTSRTSRMRLMHESRAHIRRSLNTTCVVGVEFEAAAPTASTDRLCLAIKQCESYEYEFEAPTATSDRCCRSTSQCQMEYDPYTIEASAATTTSDTVCIAATCACNGQVHPTLSIATPGYGSYCNVWESNQASFCYVDDSCPAATTDATTGWKVVSCSCPVGSAGGLTCSNVLGESQRLVLQGDTGKNKFDQWFEFSTAHEPTHIIQQISADVSECAALCSAHPVCHGFQIEELQSGDIQCTLLNDVGHRVPTTAVTKSYVSVIPSFSAVSVSGQTRFANAFDPTQQTFVQNDVADIDACLRACSFDVFCQALHIDVCPSTGKLLCIGLTAPTGLIADSSTTSISAIRTYPPAEEYSHKITVRTEAKTIADATYNQGSSLVFTVNQQTTMFEHAPVISLVEGVRYQFQLDASSTVDPLIITASSVGGPLAAVYTVGVENWFATDDVALFFTPTSSTPRELYYQSSTSTYAGGKIVVSKPHSSLADLCPATTTQAPTTTLATTVAPGPFQLSATGTQSSTPSRFSTAFDQSARLFDSVETSTATADAVCRSTCTASASCAGFFLLIEASHTTCIGLSSLGNTITTTTSSLSYTKL